ncbi:fructose PTS transporter subunit IIB [Mycoplasma marinum]|uniref:PTS fructose transporter subunit IIABC n=1 Tax=Mycoplasma marinum TaxID=1937190 RepID=A0A4R0XLH6_9MOLU|nr:fructose PTS transporter subunit IIB [Mycoplasma marinum]TCG11536.1 hypothetical protein C4B24_01665 [Mycoplasma marinum]
MKIISKNNIIIENSKPTRDELFEKVSKIAEAKGVTSNWKGVKEAFINREAQGTTGFEEGFAIPHARSEYVNEPQIFFFRTNKKIEEYDALDGGDINKAIFLLIPADAGSLHMDILSSIATKLIDSDFKEKLNKESSGVIFNILNEVILNTISPKEENHVKKEHDKFFVAITACPAGIAKTYMSKERIIQVADKMGYSVHVETQGGGIQKNAMNSEQIKKAEFVIIASEIEINLERFVNKKVTITKTKEAINDTKKLIERASKQKELTKEELIKMQRGDKNPFYFFMGNIKSSLLQIFNKPWAYLTILATFYAVLNMVGYGMYGADWFTSGWTKNQTLFTFQSISFFGFELCMPIFAGIFARKFYDKTEVFLATFIFTFILNTPMIGAMSTFGLHGVSNQHFEIWFTYGGTFNPEFMMGTSLFGGILFAPFIACIMKYVDNFKKKYMINKYVSILLKHWVSYITLAFIFSLAYFSAAPFAWLFQWVIKGIVIYPNSYWWLRFIIGGIIGVLITWDYGGTINKLTILFLIGMMQYDWRMRTLFAIAIPIASMSCGLFFKIFSKNVKSEDMEYVTTAQKFGKSGLSEGPIPFVNKYKWKAHFPSLVTAFVATGFAFVLNIQVFKTGSLGILSFGAQGYAGLDLVNGGIITNDIGFLNNLINPNNQSTMVTIVSSFIYGVIGYYLSFAIGILTYFIVGGITFNLGKKIPFIRKK